MRHVVAICGFLVFASIAHAKGSPLSLTKVGEAWMTFYWTVDEAQYPRSTSEELRDVDGQVLARVSPEFKKDLTMEGSGWLRQPAGKTVNYAKRINGEHRFHFTDHKYGRGIGNCPLVPYRTVAVDPQFIPFGTKLYVPELEGVRLPDGSIHDGIFIAHDKGSWITQNHIDFYVGVGKSGSKPFEKFGYTSKSKIFVYKLADPDPRGCHQQDDVR